MKIDNAPSLGYVIETMFAYVAVDADGEGVVAATAPGIGSMPLVGADEARMRSLRPVAVDIAKATGRQVKMIRFDVRTELEVIDP